MSAGNNNNGGNNGGADGGNKLPAKTLALLYRAVDNNDVAALREWVAANGTANIDQCADHYSRTALLEACANRRTPAALFLIRAGANPDHAGSNGLTPLHAAILGDNKDVVVALLDAGADIGKKFGDVTPLQQAAHYGRGDLMRRLIDRGADPTCVTDKGEALADIVFMDDSGKMAEMARGEASRVFGIQAAASINEGVSAPVQPLKKIKLKNPAA